jgi:hypothetical protein
MQSLTVSHTCGHDCEYQIERDEQSAALVDWLIARRCFDCGAGLVRRERRDSAMVRAIVYQNSPKRVPPVDSVTLATCERHGTPLVIIRLTNGNVVAWDANRGPISVPERLWQDRDHRETHT